MRHVRSRVRRQPWWHTLIEGLVLGLLAQASWQELHRQKTARQQRREAQKTARQRQHANNKQAKKAARQVRKQQHRRTFWSFTIMGGWLIVLSLTLLHVQENTMVDRVEQAAEQQWQSATIMVNSDARALAGTVLVTQDDQTCEAEFVRSGRQVDFSGLVC